MSGEIVSLYKIINNSDRNNRLCHIFIVASLEGLKYKDKQNILFPDIQFPAFNNGTGLHIFADAGNRIRIYRLKMNAFFIIIFQRLFSGYYKCTKFLLENGHDRDIKDNNGKTALDLAKQNGN